MYFWMSGILSAFLNARPLISFFSIWRAAMLSLDDGALFHSRCWRFLWVRYSWARDYIDLTELHGQGIAEQRGVPIPTFFGFAMMWSVRLTHVFIVHTAIFFVSNCCKRYAVWTFRRHLSRHNQINIPLRYGGLTKIRTRRRSRRQYK